VGGKGGQEGIRRECGSNCGVDARKDTNTNRIHRHSRVKKEAEVAGEDGDTSGTTEALDSLPLSSLQLVRSEILTLVRSEILTRPFFPHTCMPLILARLTPRTGNLDMGTPVSESHVALKIPCVHDYITKLCRKQREVMHGK
jgi:hypothetical protein